MRHSFLQNALIGKPEADYTGSYQAVKELQKTAFCIGFGLFVE